MMNNTQGKEFTPLFPGAGVDFITTRLSTQSGNRAEHNWFDVPNEGYSEGCLTGLKVAGLIMTWMERVGDNDSACLDKICVAAANALLHHGDGRRGAAVGLFAALEELLMRFAQTGEWRQVLSVQFASAMDAAQWDADQTKNRIQKMAAELGIKPSVNDAGTRAG